jgi:hypothetical protein
MTRLLLVFAAVEGLAVAAYLAVPFRFEERTAANLLPWVLTTGSLCWLVAWPMLTRRRAAGGTASDLSELGEESLVLAGAVAPFAAAALSLAPRGAGEVARVCLPALAALGAGALAAFAARAGGDEFARAGVAAGLGAWFAGPVFVFAGGASGPAPPGDAVTLGRYPFLAAAALLLAGGAVVARRLRAGREAVR